MDDYIKREAAIAYIREQSEEWQKAFEELGGESGIYADAYNDLAENFYGIPAAKVVSLHDIYRVIAGHSYYHGDRILAALTCIAEGKKVNPVRPSDVAPVVYGRWEQVKEWATKAKYRCSVCGREIMSAIDFTYNNYNWIVRGQPLRGQDGRRCWT